jgi:hypothetical protein
LRDKYHRSPKTVDEEWFEMANLIDSKTFLEVTPRIPLIRGLGQREGSHQQAESAPHFSISNYRPERPPIFC